MLLILAASLLTQWIQSEFPENSSVVEFTTLEQASEISREYQLFIVENRLERINELDAAYIYAPSYDLEQLRCFWPDRADLVILPAEINPAPFASLLSSPILVIGNKEQVERIAQIVGRCYEMHDGFGSFPRANAESIQ